MTVAVAVRWWRMMCSSSITEHFPALFTHKKNKTKHRLPTFPNSPPPYKFSTVPYLCDSEKWCLYWASVQTDKEKKDTHLSCQHTPKSIHLIRGQQTGSESCSCSDSHKQQNVKTCQNVQADKHLTASEWETLTQWMYASVHMRGHVHVRLSQWE